MTRKTWTATTTQENGTGAMIFGNTLITMKERGELAERGRPGEMSQAATFTLESIGLTRSQSSRYQQEASVPMIAAKAKDLYEKEAKERMTEGQRHGGETAGRGRPEKQSGKIG